jgi:hypothetical protein
MVRSSYSTSGTCREKLFLWCSFQYKTRQNNLVFLGPWLYHKWIYIYLCIQCLKLASKRFPHVIRCTRSSFTIILWCIRQWSMHNSKICLTLRICSTIVPLLQGHSFCNKKNGFIRGVAFGWRCLIRGVAFGWKCFIRGKLLYNCANYICY